METLNNVASAASKAVFGGADANKEPVSGAKGDVSKGEPYDAGNLDSESQEKVEKRLSDDKLPAGGTESSSHPRADPAVPDASQVESSNKEPESVEVKGPGPKFVEEVAREHGGDAGRDHKEPAQTTGEKDKSAEESKTTTGEVVHTTGFAVEGGDFDATKPGAGKEADRLVEQKSSGNTDQPTAGPAKPAAAAASTPDNKDSKDPKSKHGKDKPSLSQRIKAKLHRH